MHACATPTAPAATEYRPESRAVIAILKPSPTSPSRVLSGTHTSSRMRSLELDERSPSFLCRVLLPYFWVAPSETNAVIPLPPSVRSARGETRARLDTEPFRR